VVVVVAVVVILLLLLLLLVVVVVVVVVVVAAAAAALNYWGDRLQILLTLNLLENTSKCYNVAMFVILDLQPLLQTQFVEIFTLFIDTGFHTHSSTDPSVIVVMLQVQCFCLTNMFLFYILEKIIAL